MTFGTAYRLLEQVALLEQSRGITERVVGSVIM